MRVALGGVALDVLHDGALLVEIGQRPHLAHVGEAHGLGLHLRQLLLFEEGQAQILEDQRRQFVHRHVGLIVVDARLFAGVAALATSRARLGRDDIADFALAVALAGMLLASGIIAEAILLQRANRHACTIFLPSERMMLSSLTISARFFLIASRIFCLWRSWSMLPFAVQRPVVL